MTVNRWGIAIAELFCRLPWALLRLGVFAFRWLSNSLEAFRSDAHFTISILFWALRLFSGGLWLNRKGRGIVALTGGFIYGAGVFLARFSDHKLWWLYLSYGVLAALD